MKRIKQILPIIIAFIIGISTTVGAVTVFNSKDITYSSDKTDKTNVKEALDELYTKASQVGGCPIDKSCLDQSLSEIVKIGDYIKMTPTSKTYYIPEDITGYRQQMIDPSELNLWRVIKINDDGTMEMVSDKVSSTKVHFYGKEGYINFVGGLNTIAAQYTDEKNVQSTRHMGYSNQTETITNTSMITKSSPPWTVNTCNDWTCTTSGFTEAEEAQGAGDIGFKTDYQLVTAALRTVLANDNDWLASRSYRYSNSEEWNFEGNYVYSNGYLDRANLYSHEGPYDTSNDQAYAIRPIVTIKKEATISRGDGKSEGTAYVLK